RTAAALASVARVMPGRQAAVARELTKLHQEVVRDEIGALAEAMARRTLKGEVVIVVGPPLPEQDIAVDPGDLHERVDALVLEGASRSDAVRFVARETGLSRSEVYRQVHEREPASDA
ncbi:MAG: 16S rRNA (cytidine(1402)-2'-O)-methyltransferase, partial [Actinomycetota bacterium]|nr:16S rRNA (cytidine(1402)-2'-O)-methyltransferase [Actinomycetota bacterium]